MRQECVYNPCAQYKIFRRIVLSRKPKFTKEECIQELKLFAMKHPNKKITRRFYRENGSLPEFSIMKYFGSFSEFLKAANLSPTRYEQKLLRETAKHSSLDICREYFHKEVLPYHLKYEMDHKGDLITIMVCSDLHDKEVDEFALAVFLNECYRIQPDIICLNGDIFDLYEFSRYTKDPRKCDVVGRIKFVHDRVFAKLREACPKAQIDLIIGNHEYRLLIMLANTNPHLQILLADLHGMTMAKLLGLDKFRINLQAKLDLGAFSKTDIDLELRKNHKIYFKTFAAVHKPTAREKLGMSGTNGHHHKGEYTSFNNELRGACSWVQTPALHYPDAEYLEELPQWNCGFSEVTISKSTLEVDQQLRIVKPTWAKINGQIYRKK